MWSWYSSICKTNRSNKPIVSFHFGDDSGYACMCVCRCICSHLALKGNRRRFAGPEPSAVVCVFSTEFRSSFSSLCWPLNQNSNSLGDVVVWVIASSSAVSAVVQSAVLWIQFTVRVSMDTLDDVRTHTNSSRCFCPLFFVCQRFDVCGLKI